MNFSPSEILTNVTQVLISQNKVMQNRTLINRLFNGESPLSEEECRRQNARSNVNFLEATRIASNATSQINNSFFKGDKYFTVKIDKGPVRMRSQWSAEITKAINKQLKRSRSYKAARESAHAQVVLHGPGPLVWRTRRTVVPSTAGVEDILLPSGTLASMENLDYLPIYREMTWNQVFDAVGGKNVDPGWNKPYIKALQQTLYKTGLSPIFQGNRWLFPEKMAEDVKEGAAQSASSSMPKMMVYDFFFRNESNNKWNRRMVLDYANLTSSTIFSESDSVVRNKGFLYEKDDYVDDWSEIIHWYLGNCSNVAPYRYYSIRSIGYLLYGICHIQNKLRNKLYDHMFQSLLTWFHNISDEHREKLGMIDLQNFGVLPEGISMVNAQERHIVDWNLILMGLNQGRQLMAESSSSFLPDMQSQFSGKEMTATETLVRQNTSATLTSAVLNQLAEQSVYEAREICRRFCIKGNTDPMAKNFREDMRKALVPEEVLDVEAWEILPEMVVGGGNKAMELTATQALMQEILPVAAPEGQKVILRRRYAAITDNPDEAMMIFPENPQVPDEVQYAQIAFSVLMDGVPFVVKESINHLAYTGALLTISQNAFQQAAALIQQPSGIPLAAAKVAGLFNVGMHLQQEIQIVAQDKTRKEAVKALATMLQQFMAGLQDLSKQLMAMEEQQGQQQGMDPEVMQKIQEAQAMAQNKMQIESQKAQLKMQHQDIKFAEENNRRNAQTAADIRRKQALTMADVAAMHTKAENQPEPASSE